LFAKRGDIFRTKSTTLTDHVDRKNSTLFDEKLDKSALTPSTNDTCTAAASECAAAIG